MNFSAQKVGKLAWMALLRAPWCGLCLADLLVIAQEGEEDGNIQARGFWHLMENESAHARMSEDGRRRLHRVAAVLGQAEQSRDRLGLRAWIEQTWLSLNGPAATTSVHGLTDVETFMTLLEEADAAGRGLDIDWLEEQLTRRYMAGGDVLCPIQVMTIHKAKGLEFDHVLVPQMGRSTRADSRDLLLWEEYSDRVGNRAFLLAADDREKKAPTLYNFLAGRRKVKSRQENTRLMYVAATRAAKTLTLTGCVSLAADGATPKEPGANSLLHTLWPAVGPSAYLHEHGEDAGLEQGVAAGTLVRLSLPADDFAAADASEVGQFDQIDERNMGEAAVGNRPEPPTNYFERTVGTVVHLALENLSRRSPLPDQIDEHERLQWHVALRELGLVNDELDVAIQHVVQSVELALAAQSVGRWLLSSAHSSAESEWAIAQVEDDKVSQGFIDRTFIDDASGIRWVIDYKSSRPAETEPLEAFMGREARNYREQLRRYRDAVYAIEDRPVRCALYFTALGKLHVLDDLDTHQASVS